MDQRRPARGIVTIGASAGGIEALQRLMGALAGDLSAAVCLVLHIPATSHSVLAQIIGRQTTLAVTPAAGGERLQEGHVYVAPPDRHLRVHGGRLELDRGPKENGVRPAVDPLFRSAAVAYRERAIGVVLSGALSDGAGGASAIADAGGAVLVQDPADAAVPSMPESALAAVPAAVAMSATELAGEIARRAAQFPESAPEEMPMASQDSADQAAQGRRPPEGPPTALTCPECHGPLWELREDQVVRYRCRVGHSFYEDALIDGNGSAVESALWMALEALDERAELLRKVADRLESAGREKSAARYREQARGAAERAELVRGVLIVDDDPVAPVAEGAA